MEIITPAIKRLAVTPDPRIKEETNVKRPKRFCTNRRQQRGLTSWQLKLQFKRIVLDLRVHPNPPQPPGKKSSQKGKASRGSFMVYTARTKGTKVRSCLHPCLLFWRVATRHPKLAGGPPVCLAKASVVPDVSGWWRRSHCSVSVSRSFWVCLPCFALLECVFGFTPLWFNDQRASLVLSPLGKKLSEELFCKGRN